MNYVSVEKKTSRMSTIFGFSYKNWNHDPSPLVRLGKRLIDDGWHADYDGRIYFDRLLSPEDTVNVTYNFAYFSKLEMVSFLNLGLQMMNGLPPASESYSSLNSCPQIWYGGILLYAAMTALKRLIFGWSFQEKRIIYGSPEAADKALQLWQDLYKTYSELFAEFGKNAKTRKLPGMSQVSMPEYSLPGGRCMSPDTSIKFLIDGVENILTIKEAYAISLSKEILVQSMIGKEIGFERVGKIWNSGVKETYIVETDMEAIRLTADHLVYMPNEKIFKPVSEIKKGDAVLSVRNNKLVISNILLDPVSYGQEEVYDIEVPSTENFIGNSIVSHNSRWFRYLYKQGS